MRTWGQLALSIREKGQLSPIRVRWSESLEKWIIISGDAAGRATQRAGLNEIECYFHDGDLTVRKSWSSNSSKTACVRTSNPLKRRRPSPS